MGIQGLLPLMQSSSQKVNISEYSGCTVAIDAYCWLHKGAFSCAEKLARGEQTDQYVLYCMKYVNMLLSHNIKPILVFDGCHLPAKAETEKARREKREANRKRAGELLRLDRAEEARSLIRRCVDVTHEMAHSLIVECRNRNVDCIVAPFEADAQLAYLNISGIAHFVITEDSDLMLFGCSRVIFKMDVQGNGVLVEQDKLPLSMKMRPNNFTLDKFRNMCILSGCDYLPSLPGIGLQKALKFIKQTAEPNIIKALPKLGTYLNMPGICVTEEYKHGFEQAVAMFKHQPVFDPIERKVKPLTPLPAGVTQPVPLTHSPEMFFQIALGNVDPIALKVMDHWNPDNKQQGPATINSRGWNAKAKHASVWSRDFSLPDPSIFPAPKDPREVTRPSTHGLRAALKPTVLEQTLAERKLTADESVKIFESMISESPPQKILQSQDDKKENNTDDDDFATVEDLFVADEAKSSPKQSSQPSKPSLLSKIHRTTIDKSGHTVKSKYFFNEPDPPASPEPVKREWLDADEIIKRVIEAGDISPEKNAAKRAKVLSPIKGSLHEISDMDIGGPEPEGNKSSKVNDFQETEESKVCDVDSEEGASFFSKFVKSPTKAKVSPQTPSNKNIPEKEVLTPTQMLAKLLANVGKKSDIVAKVMSEKSPEPRTKPSPNIKSPKKAGVLHLLHADDYDDKNSEMEIDRCVTEGTSESKEITSPKPNRFKVNLPTKTPPSGIFGKRKEISPATEKKEPTPVKEKKKCVKQLQPGVFQWTKPLDGERSDRLAENIMSNTPPNSQETDPKEKCKLPKVPQYLGPARQVGLGRKNPSKPKKIQKPAVPSSKPTSSLLSKFGFTQREKIKS